MRHSVLLLANVLLAMLQLGCYTYDLNMTTENLAFPSVHKLEANASLHLTDSFRNHVYEWWFNDQKHKVRVGAVLESRARGVAEALFTHVTVSFDHRTEHPNADVTLIPHILRIGRPYRETWGGSPDISLLPGRKADTSCDLDWEIKDRSGRLVWAKRVVGTGEGRIGSVFTEKKGRLKAAELAIDDAFKKSFDEILSAQELKSYLQSHVR